MTSSKTLGVDIGLSGGISDGKIHHNMPTTTTEIKPAVLILAKKDGKKQYYKSGPLAGQPKHKIKTPAKCKKELDLKAIYKLFLEASTVVFESPGASIGNAAKSTASTNRNYGKLLACAELANCEIVTVTPHKWKADLKLSKDKQESIDMATSLTNHSFVRSTGGLEDGKAEAFLIRYWYLKQKE